jgi:hypothetical protein
MAACLTGRVESWEFGDTVARFGETPVLERARIAE